MSSTIDSLEPGQRAVIHAVSESAISPKLMEMGFFPGKKIKLVRKAGSNGPYYVDVQGQYFALRREEALAILLDENAS